MCKTVTVKNRFSTICQPLYILYYCITLLHPLHRHTVDQSLLVSCALPIQLQRNSDFSLLTLGLVLKCSEIQPINLLRALRSVYHKYFRNDRTDGRQYNNIAFNIMVIRQFYTFSKIINAENLCNEYRLLKAAVDIIIN